MTQVLGLHHVTATVNQAQSDLDFWRGLLGLRLVKKTVNFDNHHVYHFYYGDERGTPGTIWTTFPYADRGVRQGVHGAGQITTTSFSVPSGSPGFWRTRLAARGISSTDLAPRFGADAIGFDDPSGLRVELVEAARDAREPWTGDGIDSAHAIRGLHGVTLTLASRASTIAFMNELLGWEVTEETATRTRVAVSGGGPGRTMDLVEAPDAPTAINGLGTVHHVAMAVATAEDQLEIRRELVQRGYRVTNVLDRQYFQSIYFREPGGVLFEVATVQPGFLVDEPISALGRALKLPPWEEGNRAEIERGLAKVQY